MVLHERFAFVECTPATEDDVLRCHTPALIERVRDDARLARRATRSAPRRPTRLRCSRPAPRSRRCAAAASRSRARPATTREHERRDGLLPLRLGRDRGALGAGRARARAGRDRRLGRPPRQRHAGRSSPATTSILFVSLHQWPFYPGSGGPDEQGETLVNVPLAAGHRRRGYLEAFDDGRARGRRLRARACCSSRPGSTRTPTTRSPSMELTAGRLPRARAPRVAARAARRRGARGRLQPRDAARPGRGGARGLRAYGASPRLPADGERFSSASRREETPSFEQALHVRAHGVLGDEEALGDLVGAEMLVEQQQHLELAGGHEPRRQIRARALRGRPPAPGRAGAARPRPRERPRRCATPRRNETIRSGGSVFRR